MLSRTPRTVLQLIIVLSAGFALPTSATAQQTDASRGSSAMHMVAPISGSTKDVKPFIRTPHPGGSVVALQGHKFDPAVQGASRLFGPSRMPKLTPAIPPRGWTSPTSPVGDVTGRRTIDPNIDFNHVLAGFHAQDGPSPYVPPDPTMATGPYNVFVADNDTWSIYDF